MRILTRYIVREHIGPLAFALTALTSLLLLQYVARQLDKLVGKGLPWSVIGEFLLLSLPFTIAMTLPMAVLVATLHAFGRLSAENEITAFKASGVRVRTLMAPMLLIAAALSLLMVGFNDQVLPRANHRLSVLLGDIVSVRPTVALREQVLMPVTPTFYLKAGKISDTSNKMWDVQIYDLQNSAERRSVYADSGTFTMSPDSVDMQLVLYDGEQLQLPEGDARRLQRTFFREQVLRVEDFARGFNSSSEEGKFKGEREQGICELQVEYQKRADDYENRRQRWIAQLRASASGEDSVLRVPRPRPAHGGLAKLYCETIPAWFMPAEAQAAEVDDARPLDDTDGVPAAPRLAQAQDSAQRERARQDSIRQANVRQEAARLDSIRQVIARRDSAMGTIRPAPGSTPLPPGLVPGHRPDGMAVPDGMINPDSAMAAAQAAAAQGAMTPDGGVEGSAGNPMGAAMFAVTEESLDLALREMSKYAVEVQKKFAISMACFVFVLFGPPIALRFPRGGVGVTIGVSLVVFGAYYVCLMAGETLADKGTLDPVIAMWAANVIFTLAGLVLLWRVEKSADASRGGGIGEWWSNGRNRRSLARGARKTAASGAAST